jgi:Domain of unknown function (DUF4389)
VTTVEFDVRDDLRRSRLTVFFRLLLAIPHLLWFLLWSVAVFFVAIAAWFVGLVRGVLPPGLHGFLARYVRYGTHLFAYLSLAANPYPSFTGEPGYPVDVVIGGPVPQRRLSIAFRLVLAVPVLILLAVLIGSSGYSGWSEGGRGDDGSPEFWAGAGAGIVWAVAFLGWFASLVRGRMPVGFRNLNAYGVRYAAEASSYLLLLSERYPDADPRIPAAWGPPPPHPITIDVTDDLRRSRLTVFFRLFLSLPHLVWLLLWSVAAFFAAIANWAATLVRGTSPLALHKFLAAYVRYDTHVLAYLFLVANPFPGFTGEPGYPVDAVVAPPEPQNRWITGFRLFLAIPALIVASGLFSLLAAAAVLGWFYALATGRMAQSLRNAGAYGLRYNAQTTGYLSILTDRYPFSGPPAREEQPPAETVESPQPPSETVEATT